MKITKTQLRKIIKEELKYVLSEKQESFKMTILGQFGGQTGHTYATIHAGPDVEAAFEQAMETFAVSPEAEKEAARQNAMPTDFDDRFDEPIDAEKMQNVRFNDMILQFAQMMTDPSTSPEDKAKYKARYDANRQKIVSMMPLLDDVLPRAGDDGTLVAPTSQKYLQE